MGKFSALYSRAQSLNGQTMTEYAMILATIAVVLTSLVQTGGTLVNTLVNQVAPLLTGN